jgi:hypothetical protein
MSLPYRTRRRIVAAIATACAGLALANTAGAVDLRDWGRKFATSERFVVLAQFNNEAVIDKETQLVWMKTSRVANHYSTAYLLCIMADTGGRHGWRLPTAPEMASLMATAATSMPSVFAIPSGRYWTSSEHPQAHQYNYQYAMTIQAPDGAMSTEVKTELRPFVCVRGVT